MGIEMSLFVCVFEVPGVLEKVLKYFWNFPMSEVLGLHLETPYSHYEQSCCDLRKDVLKEFWLSDLWLSIKST